MKEILWLVVGSIIGLVVYVFQDDVRKCVHRILERLRRKKGGGTTKLHSITALLGEDRKVSHLIAMHQGTERLLGIGSIIQLAKAPDLTRGWDAEQMEFDIRDEPRELLPGLQSLCDEWKRLNPRNPDQVRYRLEGIEGKNMLDDPTVVFRMRKTHFGRVFPVQACLDKPIQIEPGVHGIPRNRFAPLILDLARSPLPNFFVFHVAILTSEGFLTLVQRATNMDYYPGHWSCSFEEQLCEQDADAQNPFDAGVKRGIGEEFGIYTPSQVKLLSVFMEYENLNTGCCAVAFLPLRAEAVVTSWRERARDSVEADRVRFVQTDVESLGRALGSGELETTDGTKVPKPLWHPTTEYRLLMAGLCMHGSRFLDTLADCSQRHGRDSGIS